MSSLSHVQIAYIRRLYDTYRSKSSGIDHNDLVLILRHLGPDVPAPVAKQMIRDFSRTGDDFIKFDDFCRLLSSYQGELPNVQMEFVKALQYFMKKKTNNMPYGISEGTGFSRSDLISILVSGSQPLSISEATAAVDDILADHLTITVKRIVKKITNNGSLWPSVSYDHKYISLPPDITLKICLTSISDMSMFERVKYRPGLGIAFKALDSFIRIRFHNSILTTPVRNANAGVFWPRVLMLPIRIPSVSLDQIQNRIGFRNSLIFDLMDSQRTSRNSISSEWIGTGRLRLITVLRQSIGVVPYEVSLNCQNANSNVKLRLTIELIGHSLGSLFDSVDAMILRNHHSKLTKELNPAATVRSQFGKREFALPGVISAITAATSESRPGTLLDRLTSIYERYIAQFPRRNVRLFGRDYNEKFALITQFVTECHVATIYQNADQLAKMVAVLNSNPPHSCESENTEIPPDVILPPDVFIRRGFASMLDRSLFLCGLFNSCGLNAYVVTGNDGLFECIWVIDFDCDGVVRHWDTLTGAYNYSNSYVPGAIFNVKQIYFNTCSDDRPDMEWDVSNSTFWQPVLSESDQLPPRYRFKLAMDYIHLPNDVTSNKLLVAGIQSYRQARLGLTTPFYGPLCKAFQSLLTRSDLDTVMTNHYLQEFARHRLFPCTLSSFRQILFKCCSINVIIQELIWMGLLDCTVADAVFGIGVHTRSHGIGLTTTTVIIGYIINLNSILLNYAE